MIFLETPRLILRPLAECDLDDLAALDRDPEVMRYLGTDGMTSAELVDAGDHWAAIERATSDFVGWFGLPALHGDPEVLELGYRLRRAVWGMGYATEGAIALVRKAFADLGARRVVAFTMSVNTGSRRVMEKAGLTYVRTFFEDWADPLPGAEQGEVEYALEKTQA